MNSREIQMRDAWRAQNGLAAVREPRVVPVKREGVNYTFGCGETCGCAKCRAFWNDYWASRYDAIAPLTDAFINERVTLPVPSSNLRTVRD